MKIKVPSNRLTQIEYALSDMLHSSDVNTAVPHDLFRMSTSLFNSDGDFICTIELKLKF